MDIIVEFPGGKRVDALVDGFRIATDQPVAGGGQGSAPAPFDLFLASLATCAGIYALGFCQARNLDTTGLKIVQHVDADAETHLPTGFQLDLVLPPTFPKKYEAAIRRSVEHCKVKKTIAAQPAFEVTLSGGEATCAVE
jgi:putative redox protein